VRRKREGGQAQQAEGRRAAQMHPSLKPPAPKPAPAPANGSTAAAGLLVSLCRHLTLTGALPCPPPAANRFPTHLCRHLVHLLLQVCQLSLHVSRGLPGWHTATATKAWVSGKYGDEMPRGSYCRPPTMNPLTCLRDDAACASSATRPTHLAAELP